MVFICDDFNYYKYSNRSACKLFYMHFNYYIYACKLFNILQLLHSAAFRKDLPYLLLFYIFNLKFFSSKKRKIILQYYFIELNSIILFNLV